MPPRWLPRALAGAPALAGAVALLAILVFAPTFSGGFVFDDHLQIEENDQLKDLRNVPGFFTSDVWSAAGIRFAPYYRPFMYTSYALEVALFGNEPWVFRVTNALIHAAVSVALMALVLRMGASLTTGVLSALLFALHPMHAEVVAWPSARPELLFALFALLAALVAARADPRRGLSGGQFLAVGGLVMLSLLSKEAGILAPILVGLVLLYRLERATTLRRVGAAVAGATPFLALFLIFLAARNAFTEVPAFRQLVGSMFQSWPDLLTGLLAIGGHYLGGMLVPVDANSFAWADWENYQSGLYWLVLAAPAVALAPWSRPAGWLAFAFLAVLVQTPGIAGQPLYQRYTYLPSIGVCVALAQVLAFAFLDGRGLRRRRAGAAVAAAIAIAYGVLLVPRALEWRSDAELWQASFARDPRSPVVIANYSHDLVARGRSEEALRNFRRLEDYWPGYYQSPYGMAESLFHMKRYEEAVPLYRAAIERKPDMWFLRLSLGRVYERMGRFDDARRVYQEAELLHPDAILTQHQIGKLGLRSGEPERALAELDEAIAVRPEREELYADRVIALARAGRVDEAIAQAEALLGTKTQVGIGHRHLAVIYLRYRDDKASAIEHYEAYLEYAPPGPDALAVQQTIARLRRELAQEATSEARSP